MNSNVINNLRKIPIFVSIAILIYLFAPLFIPIFFGFTLTSLAWELQDSLTKRFKFSEKTTFYLSPALIVFVVMALISVTIWSLLILYKIASLNFKGARIHNFLDRIEASRTFTELNRLSSSMNMGELSDHYNRLGESLLQTISNFLSYVATSVPDLVVAIFICLVVFFSLYSTRKSIIQFRDSQHVLSPHLLQYLGRSFTTYSHSTFFATLVCALAQGSIIGLGAQISDVGRGFLWGSLASLLALIPYFGTAPISFALTAYLYLDQGLSFNTWIMGISGFVASVVDNVLRPVLVKGHRRTSPTLTLLSIFGGLYMMGPAGIFIGPILCGISIDLLEYKWNMEKSSQTPETSSLII